MVGALRSPRPRMYSIYEQAIAEGKSEKVALEEFDDALERLGL